MALIVGAQAFFEPARTATIPNITSAEELMPANALSSATWSAMLAIGRLDRRPGDGAGRPQRRVRRQRRFVLRVRLLHRADDATTRRRPALPGRRGFSRITGITDLIEGFRYVRRHRHVAALMFVKAGWGLAGGVLLLLTIFGERVFPVGGSSAAGIGVLYGARGIGAGLGPIALRWILGQEPRRAAPDHRTGVLHGRRLLHRARRRADAAGSPRCASCCAHFGGAILWVFSTVLLQLEVPDRFRGRVFAAELALVTLLSSASSYWTGHQLDRAGWSPRRLPSRSA